MGDIDTTRSAMTHGGPVRDQGADEDSSSLSSDQQGRRSSESGSSRSTAASRSDVPSRSRGELFSSSFSFSRLASAVSALHRVATSEFSTYRETFSRSRRQPSSCLTSQSTPENSATHTDVGKQGGGETKAGAQQADPIMTADCKGTTGTALAAASGEEFRESGSTRRGDATHPLLLDGGLPVTKETRSHIEEADQRKISNTQDIVVSRQERGDGGGEIFLSARSSTENVQEIPSCQGSPSQAAETTPTATTDSSCTALVQSRTCTSQAQHEGEQTTSSHTGVVEERRAGQGEEVKGEEGEVRMKTHETADTKEDGGQHGVVDDPRVDDFDMHGALVFDDYELLNYPVSPSVTTVPLSPHSFITRRASTIQQTTARRSDFSCRGSGAPPLERHPGRKEVEEEKNEEGIMQPCLFPLHSGRSSAATTQEEGVSFQSSRVASMMNANDAGRRNSIERSERLQSEGSGPSDAMPSSCPVSDSSEPLLHLSSHSSRGNLRGCFSRSSTSSASSFGPLRHIEELKKNLRGAVHVVSAFDGSGRQTGGGGESRFPLSSSTGVWMSPMRWHPLIRRCVFGPLVREGMFSKWKNSSEVADAVVVVKLSDYVVHVERGGGDDEGDRGGSMLGSSDMARRGGRREEDEERRTRRESKKVEDEGDRAGGDIPERKGEETRERSKVTEDHLDEKNKDESSSYYAEPPLKALDVEALETNVTRLFNERPQAIVLLNDLPLSCKALVFAMENPSPSSFSSSEEKDKNSGEQDDISMTREAALSSTSLGRSPHHQVSSARLLAVADPSPSSTAGTGQGASERKKEIEAHPSTGSVQGEGYITDREAGGSHFTPSSFAISRNVEGSHRSSRRWDDQSSPQNRKRKQRGRRICVPFTPGVFTRSFLETISSSPSPSVGVERSSTSVTHALPVTAGEGDADTAVMTATTTTASTKETPKAVQTFIRNVETITSRTSAAAAEAGKGFLSDLFSGVAGEDDEDVDDTDAQRDDVAHDEWCDTRKENVPVVILVMRGGTDLAALSQVEGIRRACITPIPLRIGDHIYRTIKPRGI
ncbi:lecithin retinol acyltransferase, partial [Cystoisospora suis]